MRVADLGTLAKQRIGLVEEDHAVDTLRFGEDAVEVLFGLADVLVDNGRQVDCIQVKTELAGEHFGRHRLTRARGPGEQRR